MLALLGALEVQAFATSGPGVGRSSLVEQEFAALRENRSAAERVARAAVRRMAKGDPEPTEANSFGTRFIEELDRHLHKPPHLWMMVGWLLVQLPAAVIGGFLAGCCIPYGFYLSLILICSAYVWIFVKYIVREHGFRRTVTRTFANRKGQRQDLAEKLRRQKSRR